MKPERVVIGLHFQWAPCYPLVEVIPGLATSENNRDRAFRTDARPGTRPRDRRDAGLHREPCSTALLPGQPAHLEARIADVTHH